MDLAQHTRTEFVILKANANVASAENCRGSCPTCPCALSCISSAERFWSSNRGTLLCPITVSSLEAMLPTRV